MNTEEPIKQTINRVLTTDNEEYMARLCELERKYLEIEKAYDLNPPFQITEEERTDPIVYTKKLIEHIKDCFAAVAAELQSLKIMEKMFDDAITAAKDKQNN